MARQQRTGTRGAARPAPEASEANEARGGLTRPEARIAELEAELVAARKTIRALLDSAEAQGGYADKLEGHRREVEEKSAALEAANLELRNLMSNFDKIVRQRNRALVESEAQLRRKNEELRRMNEVKSEFISIAAHELRTPLTCIVGYLDLMTEGGFGKLGARLSKPVDMARRNADRLVRLVEEMLDLSRIERGKVSLRREPCDLVAIVRDVVDVLTPLAATHNHRLDAVGSEDRLEIVADGDKINQIVTNLVSNAVRYTPDGGHIRATVDRAPREQYAGHWARVRVRDDGVGIPRDLRDRIFEPFSDIGSAKHHTSSVPDSAGLGLYIARGLVDLHGGIISVDSEEGRYTEFTVLLPLDGPPSD